MSASPMARQAVESKAIPIIRKVFVDDPDDLPSHLSSTPGGTLFSTTPGGTKIVYEKSFLMTLRNSPISKTPPNFDIPEPLMIGGSSPTKNHAHINGHRHQNNHKTAKHLRVLKPNVPHHANHQQNHHIKPIIHEDQFQIEL